jgi:hypothetical protein
MREPIILYWAGQERPFALPMARLLDLEQATETAFATVYLRLATCGFFVKDVSETIRLGLIGGGAKPEEAHSLVRKHLEWGDLIDHAQIAQQVVAHVMTGIESVAGQKATTPTRMKWSEMSQVCRVFNMSPGDLGAMAYADFVNMMRGYAAATKDNVEPPTEAEFEAMVERARWAQS